MRSDAEVHLHSDPRMVRGLYAYDIDPTPLSRITITLDDSQHRSLKLLSILENKTLAQVLQEAIHDHLQRKGADRLEVTQGQQLGGND
ncbi:MAG: hypothetical protein VKM01_00450 [Cyanobacteriota bacterium]|nr:hypothetical protein [Cyanobacteriota bacterium]